MAAIVRRSFDEMRDETLRRMGKINLSTALAPRVEQVMTSAYFDLALTFHHYELHKLDFLVLDDSFNTLTLPEDLFVLISVGTLPNPSNGATWKTATHADLRVVSPVQIEGDSTPGQPEAYARTYDPSLQSASKHILWFDTIADQDYNVQVRYYKRPVAPDFDQGASESELNWLWDEHIIQHTLALFWPAGFRFDFAQVAQQTLQGFLASQIQAPLVTGVRDFPEKELSDVALGGQQ